MCGRSACTLAPQEIKSNLKVNKWEKQDLYRPSYNVCPSRYQPVMVFDNERVLRCMKWGGVGNNPQHNTINARSEALTNNSMWSRLVKKKRCVVVASGYFEWKTDGSKKLPHYVHFKDKPLLPMAGLYEEREVNGETEYHYTIITTRCAKDIAWLHDRMPVILDTDEKIDAWISDDWESNAVKLMKMMQPYEGLECYPVPPVVNSNKNDSPDCIKKFEEFKKTGGIASFFTRLPKKEEPKSEVKVENQSETKKEETVEDKNEKSEVKVGVKRELEDDQDEVKDVKSEGEADDEDDTNNNNEKIKKEEDGDKQVRAKKRRVGK
jgi:putative SOS response-associated peptidase YedK